MAYNYEYPYTDPSIYNDDWLIKMVVSLAEQWKSVREAWTNQQQAFEDLKKFVIDSFNDLDLTAQVNAKIESMVQSGEFIDIIKPYLPSQDDIDKLKADVSIIQTQMNNFLFASDYGVSETAQDNTPFFTQLFADAVSQGKAVWIETGVYICASTIRINFNTDYTGGNNLIIYGNNSKLYFKTDVSGFNLINYNEGDYTQQKYFVNLTIKDLILDTITSNRSTGINFGGFNNRFDSLEKYISLENITVYHFNIGIQFVNARHFVFTNCIIRGSSYALSFYTAISKDLSEFCGDIIFDDCEFVCNSLVTALRSGSVAQYAIISGVHFNSCFFYTISNNLTYIVFNVQNIRYTDWFFDGCQFDQINNIFLINTNTNNDSNIKDWLHIIGCYFNSSNIVMTAYEGTSRILFSSNTVDSTGNPFVISGCQFIIFDNNNVKFNNTLNLSSNTNITIAGNIFNPINSSTTALDISNCSLVAVNGNVFNTTQPLLATNIQNYNISGNTAPNVQVNQFA